MIGHKRNLIILASLIFGGVLAVIGAANMIGTNTVELKDETHRIATRSLIFRDAPSGGIAVLDSQSTTPFTVLDREGNPFLASAIRLMGSERARMKANMNLPFELTQWTDGRYSLIDQATGETIELTAFGPTNVKSFAKLMNAEPPKTESKIQ